MNSMREWIEMSSEGIQALAVVIIVVSIIFGFARYVLQLVRRSADSYRAYKRLLGRSLMLALEILVAADVIRTVLLDLTAKGLEILGALVVVRTFLSWSLVVELEGHWPWQSSAVATMSKGSGGDEGEGVLGSVGELDVEGIAPAVSRDGAVLSNSQGTEP
jgi:uncharacterized membrane protein